LIVITWLEPIAELPDDVVVDIAPVELVLAMVVVIADAVPAGAAFVPLAACAISTTATSATTIPPANSAARLELPDWET
jgi:hypothetical protein